MISLTSLLPFLILEFVVYNCLKINELKIGQFLAINNLQEEPKDKDFLDVDVNSDILPSVTSIFDVISEPVHIHEHVKPSAILFNTFSQKISKPLIFWTKPINHTNAG